MVRYMQEHFNSRPEELVAAIGPSICVDCYEVSEEVAEQFREAFRRMCCSRAKHLVNISLTCGKPIRAFC